MIFDSHAHYDDKQFAGDRDELLSSMAEYNIRKIVNVGASIESSKRALALADRYDFIYAAVGVHPSDISCLEEAGRNDEKLECVAKGDGSGIAWLRQAVAHKKVVAIGEIGLDYYWDKEPKVQERQQWFRRQLQLARELKLPIIIHSRDAAEDTLEILKEDASKYTGNAPHRIQTADAKNTVAGAENESEKWNPGVIHCFSYSRELALEYVKMGYYIGVGGVVTFKNAKKLKAAVDAIPLERIVIETDCPYLTPEPYRGKRNASIYLPYVIEEIARIKGATPDEVERVTYENAIKLYGGEVK